MLDKNCFYNFSKLFLDFQVLSYSLSSFPPFTAQPAVIGYIFSNQGDLAKDPEHIHIVQSHSIGPVVVLIVDP